MSRNFRKHSFVFIIEFTPSTHYLYTQEGRPPICCMSMKQLVKFRQEKANPLYSPVRSPYIYIYIYIYINTFFDPLFALFILLLLFLELIHELLEPQNQRAWLLRICLALLCQQILFNNLKPALHLQLM